MTAKKNDATDAAKAAAEATTATAKTFTDLGLEGWGKVVDEMEKSVGRGFGEAQRVVDETARIGELQMKTAQELSQAWFESAKRFQQALR